MSMKRITLRLARNDGFPTGDPLQGYVVVAPLDAGGRIDLPAWQARRKECVVERFHPDAGERADGWLTHSGSHWRFRYDEEHEGPDEPGYKLGEHKFLVGEYVTFAHHGEEPLTYRVTSIEDIGKD